MGRQRRARGRCWAAVPVASGEVGAGATVCVPPLSVRHSVPKADPPPPSEMVPKQDWAVQALTSNAYRVCARANEKSGPPWEGNGPLQAWDGVEAQSFRYPRPQRRNGVGYDRFATSGKPLRCAPRDMYASTRRRKGEVSALLPQPGLAHRLAVEDPQNRRDEDQDDLIDWPWDRQECNACDPPQRLGNPTVPSQDFHGADRSKDERPCTPHARALVPQPGDRSARATR